MIKLKGKDIQKEKGITLIALVVTIVVLLILAAISISALRGDDGIAQNAQKTKKVWDRESINEELQLAMESAKINSYINQNQEIMDNVIKELSSQGINIKGITRDGSFNIDGISFEDDYINLEKDKPVNIKIKPIISGGIKDYYVEIKGQWYPVNIEDGKINIGQEVVNDIGEEPIPNLGGKMSITIDDNSIATGVASETENLITLTPGTIGQTNIMVSAIDIPNSANGIIEVKQLIKLKSINNDNNSKLVLDGASLLTATLNDGNNSVATSNDVFWKSSNTDIATVKPNGIVMAGKQTGEFTITCIGADETSQNIDMISTAKIVYTNDKNANTTFSGETTGFNYNNPVIPVGFSAVNTNDAKWTNLSTDYNKGLVIMDENGNQFVWVPVDGNEITYTKWCTNYDSYTNSTGDEIPQGVVENNTDNQVIKYKGFYVGRYEAGLDVDMGSNAQLTASETERNKTTHTPIIVEGAVPWNFIYYSYSKINAEKVYPQTNTFLQSGLINGIQWDTTLKCIQEFAGKNTEGNNVDVNSTGWGNHYDSSVLLDRFGYISSNNGASWTVPQINSGDSYPRKKNNGAYILRTGAGTYTKAMNISDMAGNLYEWTSELHSSFAIYRGGGYNYQGTLSAGFRTYHYKTGYSFKYVGYRVALYIK